MIFVSDIMPDKVEMGTEPNEKEDIEARLLFVVLTLHLLHNCFH